MTDRLKPPPIVRIHPARFEVIIDLNLEDPGGREAARKWVLANIERAKAEAGVRDAGQGVQMEKDQPNSQYMFARLEARAIQKLVELDMAHAQTAAEKRQTVAGSPASCSRRGAVRLPARQGLQP